MAIIQFVLTLFLLGTVYVRMVRRETPEARFPVKNPTPELTMSGKYSKIHIVSCN